MNQRQFIKITAVFIGADGSLGYKRNDVYTLYVSAMNGVTIQRKDGSGFCPYYTLSAFLSNWTNINHCKPNLADNEQGC